MGAFNTFVGNLTAKGMSKNEAGAVAYGAGKKKYGAKAMAKGSAAGKPAKNFAKGKGK